jgi:cellulose biosynthesis protein BcsQ
MARRVAIGNNKGGSAKTATTVGLAAALAEAGHRVLVVDLDPQANASRRLGWRLDPAAPTPTVSEAIEESRPGSEGLAAAAVTPCGWPEPYAGLIDLVPARFDLENRISEAATVGAVGRLRRALAGADTDHALTLLDCPPSLGHLTQLGLAVADVAVATIEPEFDAVEGGLRYRDFIAAAAAELGNPGLRLAGVIVGRVRSNLGAHAYQLDGLAEVFGAELIWSPYVPERTVIKDAGDTAQPLRALGSVAATGMAEVYGELAARLVREVLG